VTSAERRASEAAIQGNAKVEELTEQLSALKASHQMEIEALRGGVED